MFRETIFVVATTKFVVATTKFVVATYLPMYVPRYLLLSYICCIVLFLVRMYVSFINYYFSNDVS